jgi:hypothetical protein
VPESGLGEKDTAKVIGICPEMETDPITAVLFSDHLLQSIFGFLDGQGIATARLVCERWKGMMDLPWPITLSPASFSYVHYAGAGPINDLVAMNVLVDLLGRCSVPPVGCIRILVSSTHPSILHRGMYRKGTTPLSSILLLFSSMMEYNLRALWEGDDIERFRAMDTSDELSLVLRRYAFLLSIMDSRYRTGVGLGGNARSLLEAALRWMERYLSSLSSSQRERALRVLRRKKLFGHLLPVAMSARAVREMKILMKWGMRTCWDMIEVPISFNTKYKEIALAYGHCIIEKVTTAMLRAGELRSIMPCLAGQRPTILRVADLRSTISPDSATDTTERLEKRRSLTSIFTRDWQSVAHLISHIIVLVLPVKRGASKVVGGHGPTYTPPSDECVLIAQFLDKVRMAGTCPEMEHAGCANILAQRRKSMSEGEVSLMTKSIHDLVPSLWSYISSGVLKINEASMRMSLAGCLSLTEFGLSRAVSDEMVRVFLKEMDFTGMKEVLVVAKRKERVEPFRDELETHLMRYLSESRALSMALPSEDTEGRQMRMRQRIELLSHIITQTTSCLEMIDEDE